MSPRNKVGSTLFGVQQCQVLCVCVCVCVCTQLLLRLEQENHGQMQAMLFLVTPPTQMVHTLTACGVVCVIHVCTAAQ